MVGKRTKNVVNSSLVCQESFSVSQVVIRYGWRSYAISSLWCSGCLHHW